MRLRDELVHLGVRTHTFNGQVTELCDFVLPMSRVVPLTQELIAAIEEHERRPVNVVAVAKAASKRRRRRSPQQE